MSALTTAAGETAATVQEVIDALSLGIQENRWAPGDVFVTSSDPEGNSFVAFIKEDIEGGLSAVERAFEEDVRWLVTLGDEEAKTLQRLTPITVPAPPPPTLGDRSAENQEGDAESASGGKIVFGLGKDGLPRVKLPRSRDTEKEAMAVELQKMLQQGGGSGGQATPANKPLLSSIKKLPAVVVPAESAAAAGRGR